jgi:hypothetical protein
VDTKCIWQEVSELYIVDFRACGGVHVVRNNMAFETPLDYRDCMLRRNSRIAFTKHYLAITRTLTILSCTYMLDLFFLERVQDIVTHDLRPAFQTSTPYWLQRHSLRRHRIPSTCLTLINTTSAFAITRLLSTRKNRQPDTMGNRR